MQLDSAGRISLGFLLPEGKNKRINFYLCWHKRRPRGAENTRILVECSESIDDEKPYIGYVNMDSKCRVSVVKILARVYGDINHTNILVYKQNGNIYIEKE